MIIKQEIEWHYDEDIPYDKLEDTQPILILWDDGDITLACWDESKKMFYRTGEVFIDNIKAWAHFEHPGKKAK